MRLRNILGNGHHTRIDISFLILLLTSTIGLLLLIYQIKPQVEFSTYSIGSTITTYQPNPAANNAIVWSPDGTLIASDTNGSVKILNAASGKLVSTCCSFASEITAVMAWSPDGSRIALSYGDTVQVWDIKHKKMIVSYKGVSCSFDAESCSVAVIAWSPDSRDLASGSCGVAEDMPGLPANAVSMQLHDSATGKSILTYDGLPNCINDIMWTPDGQEIITDANNNTVEIWNARTEKRIFQYRSTSQSEVSVKASPDGKYIAIVGTDYILHVIDARTLSPILTYTIASSHTYDDSQPPFFFWSPDSKQIVCAPIFDGRIQVMDVGTGNDTVTYDSGTDARINEITWSPDNTRIAIVDANADVKVWQATYPQKPWFQTLLDFWPFISISITFFTASFFILYFSASLPRLVGTIAVAVLSISILTCFTIFIQSANNARLLSSLPGTVHHTFSGDVVAWSPDSNLLAIGLSDGTIYVWNATSAERIATNHSRSSRVKALTWSPDGTRIAAGYNDGIVQIVDAATGHKVYNYTNHVNSIVALSWSPDGTRIASASVPDKIIYVWQANSDIGKTLAMQRGTGLAWSPNSAFIAAINGSDSVDIWRANSGKEVLTYHSQKQAVLSAAWSPDGRYIASGDDDGTVQIWNASTGRIRLTHRGVNADPVLSVAWSPDARRIAATDKGFSIWDAQTGLHTVTYDISTDLSSNDDSRTTTVAWAPDGTRVASIERKGLVKIWQIKAVQNTVNDSYVLLVSTFSALFTLAIVCLVGITLFFDLRRTTSGFPYRNTLRVIFFLVAAIVSISNLTVVALQSFRSVNAMRNTIQHATVSVSSGQGDDATRSSTEEYSTLPDYGSIVSNQDILISGGQPLYIRAISRKKWDDANCLSVRSCKK